MITEDVQSQKKSCANGSLTPCSNDASSTMAESLRTKRCSTRTVSSPSPLKCARQPKPLTAIIPIAHHTLPVFGTIFILVQLSLVVAAQFLISLPTSLPLVIYLSRAICPSPCRHTRGHARAASACSITLHNLVTSAEEHLARLEAKPRTRM